MSLVQENPLEAFQWQRQPAAEQLVRELVSDFIGKNDFARTFAQQLHAEAGVRFVDLVDDIALPATDALRAIEICGVCPQSRGEGRRMVHASGWNVSDGDSA